MFRIASLLVVSMMFCFAAMGAPDQAGQSKSGVITSADAQASTFVVTLNRPMTITVNEKTVITLDGKASTFAAAIKPDMKVSVTYKKSGETRLASTVAVTSAAAKPEAAK